MQQQFLLISLILILKKKKEKISIFNELSVDLALHISLMDSYQVACIETLVFYNLHNIAVEDLLLFLNKPKNIKFDYSKGDSIYLKDRKNKYLHLFYSFRNEMTQLLFESVKVNSRININIIKIKKSINILYENKLINELNQLYSLRFKHYDIIIYENFKNEDDINSFKANELLLIREETKKYKELSDSVLQQLSELVI